MDCGDWMKVILSDESPELLFGAGPLKKSVI